MIYIGVLIVLIIILTIYTGYIKEQSTMYILLLLISFFAALNLITIYVSKDTLYQYKIKEYFYLPNFLWTKLFYLDISKKTIIRLINISSLMILVTSTFFVFSKSNSIINKYEKLIKKIIIIYALFQMIIYDPLLEKKLYYLLYPDYLTVKEFNFIKAGLTNITHTLNIFIVVMGLVFLIHSVMTSTKLKLILWNNVFLVISYAYLVFVYVIFISKTPAYLMKYSKISNTESYLSLVLNENLFLYKSLPLLLMIILPVFYYSSYKLLSIKNQIQLQELVVSKEISSSETTSKIFCHYIKNEILAIQSEVLLIKEDSDNKKILDDIDKRCNLLYTRVDEIHRSTRTAQLNLKVDVLQTIIINVLKELEYSLKDVKITTDFPVENVIVMVDRKFMEQAFLNIINNAIESMENLNNKELLIKIIMDKRWIQIEITDKGKGIATENLEKIFLPFYSTNTYSKHWGIGLTLSYKVIHAHEGKIYASSVVGQGSTFYIFLPRISTDHSE